MLDVRDQTPLILAWLENKYNMHLEYAYEWFENLKLRWINNWKEPIKVKLLNLHIEA